MTETQITFSRQISTILIINHLKFHIKNNASIYKLYAKNFVKIRKLSLKSASFALDEHFFIIKNCASKQIIVSAIF
mgnify:CR=1 FL=1